MLKRLKTIFEKQWTISSLHPNIKRLALFAMLREFNPLLPVIIIFGASRNVSDADYMATQAVFSLTLLLAEPLLSPLADKYGRRNSMLAGILVWLLGHLAFYVAWGLVGFMLVEVVLGISMALFGAAAKALLYESFLDVNRAEEHFRASAVQAGLVSYVNGIAMLVGGILVGWGINLPLLVTMAFIVLMLPVVLGLTETRHYVSISEKTMTYGQMWRSARESLLLPHVRWLVMLPGLISSGTIVLFWSVQPVYLSAGSTPQMLGILLMGLCIARGTFAFFCAWLAENISGKQCFAFCIAALGIAFPAMAFLPWWASYLPVVVGAGCTFMLASTMGNELLNRHLPSAVRGTALGAASVVGRFMSVATLFGYHVFRPVLGLSGTLVLIGAFTVAASTIVYMHLPKRA